ncbi:hypothetical protein CF138_17730 [Aeromonas hydrophila]|nr:hypothetical protein CF138_17730 [Aeromonas hydrophila]TNH93371.1 hypothetical protein CF136_22330 [Aeromonas hydrophila]TNI91328.1 hypothetical protein CF118_21080 [Aeromonas hydrophila]
MRLHNQFCLAFFFSISLVKQPCWLPIPTIMCQAIKFMTSKQTDYFPFWIGYTKRKVCKISLVITTIIIYMSWGRETS